MRALPFRLPLTSRLHDRMQKGDYLDSYAVPLAESGATPLELAQRIAVMPGWVNLLLLLRNGLVAPLGLRTSGPPPSPDPGIGDYVGIFRLESVSDSEAILGENDAHLDFRISVLKTSGPDARVALSTWVHPHNRLGRLYLATVLPFHRVIVPRMLANVAP